MSTVTTRMGDGTTVAMTRDELRRDIIEGSEAAAKKAKIPVLEEREVEYLVDMFACPSRVWGVERGHEAIMTKDGGTNTLNEFYNGQVTRLGQKIKTVETNAYNHNLVSSALGDQRESVAGVNLDEEAASLVQYQRANQAAARIMTAYDELLDLVINGMGVVGR